MNYYLRLFCYFVFLGIAISDVVGAIVVIIYMNTWGLNHFVDPNLLQIIYKIAGDTLIDLVILLLTWNTNELNNITK